MDLNSVYNEIILEHNRSLHNRKEIDDPTIKECGHNPSCGDDISLSLKIDGDEIIDAAFSGSGCAISQASTSMMIDLIKGTKLSEAKEKANLFIGMIKKDVNEDDLDVLGDAIILQNISNMPARVKCAVLSWHSLLHAIEKFDKK